MGAHYLNCKWPGIAAPEVTTALGCSTTDPTIAHQSRALTLSMQHKNAATQRTGCFQSQHISYCRWSLSRASLSFLLLPPCLCHSLLATQRGLSGGRHGLKRSFSHLEFSYPHKIPCLDLAKPILWSLQCLSALPLLLQIETTPDLSTMRQWLLNAKQMYSTTKLQSFTDLCNYLTF